MHLHIGFFIGSILVHNKFIGTPNLSLMIVGSLSGVGGNMQQPELLVLFPWTSQHVVPLDHVAS